MSALTGAERTGPLRVSVIVPVHNGAATLGRCLRALVAACSSGLDEILIVDDRSTDGSVAIAESLGIAVLPNPRGRGPAAARNAGAQCARGDVLFFIDSDVIVKETTVAQVRAFFDAHQGAAAVFGSYDEEPTAANFLSQYKNLFHHFTHQTANPDSCSFWAGCGAIRREAFEAVGGFDELTYSRPSIEDIELGSRLSVAQYRVQVDRSLLVTHQKRWTALSLMKAEIRDRAYPWSALLVAGDAIPNDLNVRWSARISAVLVGVLAIALPFLGLGHRRFYDVPVFDVALTAATLALVHVIALNRAFYLFLFRARGGLFTLRAFPLHLLYYLYSGVVYAVCWIAAQVRPTGSQRRKRPAPA
jgi:glycosyltransferase involved in cell wall biosynthesis